MGGGGGRQAGRDKGNGAVTDTANERPEAMRGQAGSVRESSRWKAVRFQCVLCRFWGEENETAPSVLGGRARAWGRGEREGGERGEREREKGGEERGEREREIGRAARRERV